MHRYELTLATAIGPRLLAGLGCEPADGRAPTRLLRTGPIDQAGLFGLLRRVRDVGLELVAVRRLPIEQQGAVE